MGSSYDRLPVPSSQERPSIISPYSKVMAGIRLIVFGPQTVGPSKEVLAEIRKYLLSGPRLGSFLDALKNLPNLWDHLVRNDRSLKAAPGRETLELLADWIQYNEAPDGSNAESNLLGMSLTIVIHVAQYFRYLDGNITHSQLIEHCQGSRVLPRPPFGCCCRMCKT